MVDIEDFDIVSIFVHTAKDGFAYMFDSEYGFHWSESDIVENITEFSVLDSLFNVSDSYTKFSSIEVPVNQHIEASIIIFVIRRFVSPLV